MRAKTTNTTKNRHKKVLKEAKGMRAPRSNSYRRAKEATMKAGVNAYRDRKRKKREFRNLWNIRINAGARENDLSYSKLINLLKKANVELDRKILAGLASEKPEVFKRVVEELKK
jgi:large subunit ribosomal protein L20